MIKVIKPKFTFNRPFTIYLLRVLVYFRILFTKLENEVFTYHMKKYFPVEHEEIVELTNNITNIMKNGPNLTKEKSK